MKVIDTYDMAGNKAERGCREGEVGKTAERVTVRCPVIKAKC